MQKIKIRTAVSKDVPVIFKLIARGERQGFLLKRPKKEIRAVVKKRNVFVAENSRGIIGIVALDFYSKRLSEIRSVFVERKFRGQGIGRMLLEKAIKRAKKLGVDELMTISVPSMAKWFMKRGFDERPHRLKVSLFKTVR